MNASMTTTTFELPGYRVVESLGIVRGISVRSRSFLGAITANFETFRGGRLKRYTELCEQTRKEAFDILLEHAQDSGGR